LKAYGVFIFKLEEASVAPLLYLLKIFAETAVFGSAFDLGCRLVVGFLQAINSCLLLGFPAGATMGVNKETLYAINPTAQLWATQARPMHYC
jgi:hypothetical protein